MDLGTFIKEKRIEKNLSLRDIDKLGFNKGLLSLIENNLRQPKFETLQQIANILEINIVELYIIAGYLTKTDIDYIKNNK